MPAHSRGPGSQLLLRARVAEREHRLAVGDLLQVLDRLGTDALGGRVGRDELGMLGLEPAQLVEQRVVDVVVDGGVVEDVVAVVVVLELAAQLRGAVLCSGRSAHSTSRAAGRRRRARSCTAKASMPARSVKSKCTGVTAMWHSAMAARSVPSSWW